MGSGSSKPGSANSRTSGSSSKSKGSSKPLPKPVAFEVDLGDIKSSKKSTKPKRIQELEQNDSSTKITAEQIEEKLRSAEENRKKNLERVRKSACPKNRTMNGEY